MTIKKVSASFLTDEEIEIKKIHFNTIEEIDFFQGLYFLYNRSNVIKRTFINEINKFLPIYCLGSFFGETDTEKIDLITGKNSKSFFVEKDTEKSEIKL